MINRVVIQWPRNNIQRRRTVISKNGIFEVLDIDIKKEAGRSRAAAIDGGLNVFDRMRGQFGKSVFNSPLETIRLSTYPTAKAAVRLSDIELVGFRTARTSKDIRNAGLLV